MPCLHISTASFDDRLLRYAQQVEPASLPCCCFSHHHPESARADRLDEGVDRRQSVVDPMTEGAVPAIGGTKTGSSKTSASCSVRRSNTVRSRRRCVPVIAVRSGLRSRRVKADSLITLPDVVMAMPSNSQRIASLIGANLTRWCPAARIDGHPVWYWCSGSFVG